MPPKKAPAAKAASKKAAAVSDDAKSKSKSKSGSKSESTTTTTTRKQEAEAAEADAPTTKAENGVVEEDEEDKKEEETAEDAAPTTTSSSKDTAKPNTSKKRKSPTSDGKDDTSNKPPAKTPRQGTRLSSRTKQSSSSSSKPATPSTRQILNFLLTPAALPYCYPADELSASAAKKYSTTSPAAFTPFEHLLTASLLSKPLSHVLGMRSARTLLNDPYALSSPAAIVAAGETRVWEALEAARTQHRQKTAGYVFDMGEAFEDGDAMGFLQELVNDKGAEGVVQEIGKNVKGMGRTGAEIFCRRVQAVEGWGDAVWPFADGRSLDALRQLGVEVKDADELQEMVEGLVDWQKVGTMGLDGQDEEMEMEQQIQVEFVVLLERAVGAALEGKTEEVKKAAMESKGD